MNGKEVQQAALGCGLSGCFLTFIGLGLMAFGLFVVIVMLILMGAGIE